MTERKPAAEMLRDLFEYWPTNDSLVAALDEALAAERKAGYVEGYAKGYEDGEDLPSAPEAKR